MTREQEKQFLQPFLLVHKAAKLPPSLKYTTLLKSLLLMKLMKARCIVYLIAMAGASLCHVLDILKRVKKHKTTLKKHYSAGSSGM